MSAEEVAKAFVQHFYATFDSNADHLGGLFVSISCSRMPMSLHCLLAFARHILMVMAASFAVLVEAALIWFHPHKWLSTYAHISSLVH